LANLRNYIDIANVTVQIFRQIAVRVVGVLIGLLHGVLELETVVVGRSVCYVVHTIQAQGVAPQSSSNINNNKATLGTNYLSFQRLLIRLIIEYYFKVFVCLFV